MKKLMTMLAAVAMAFGLYATEEFKAGTCFNDWTDISEPKTGDENLTWSASLYQSTLLDPAGWSGLTVPARWFEAAAGKALNVKTALGTEFVTCAPTSAIVLTGDEKIYVDTLVKFTAFDEAAQFEDATAKLAVWIREMYDNDGETIVGTNLYVTAGVIDDQGEVTQESYDCGEYTAGEWCRLTIKSLGSVNGTGTGVYGFVVYIDGKPVSCTTDKGFGYVTLGDLAAYYNANNILFPSLVKGTEISSLAISGQGAIDDIAFTTEAPDFAVDMLKATITLDGVMAAQLGTITVSTNGEVVSGIDLSSGPASIYYKKTSGVPTIKVVWTGAGNVLAGEAESSTGALTIDATDLKKAVAQIDDAKYETLAAAVAEAAGKTIVLIDDVEENVAFNVAGATLDLNGKVLTGDVSLAMSAGLVIDDTATGGKVTGSISTMPMGTFQIKAGTFDGTLNITIAKSIIGGAFKNDPNALLADGYIAPKDTTDNYYKVKQGAWAFEVSGAKFETLAEAFAAVQAGGKITVIGDTLVAGVRATNTQNNVTLDLNGKTLTHASDNKDYTMIVCGSLVITNGTIVKNSQTTMIKVGLKETGVDIPGTLTIADATIDDQTATTGCALNIENGSAILKSGAIKTAGHTQDQYETVRVKEGCSFTMEDGEIVSDKYAITIKSGATAVSIQGGEITGAIENAAELTEFISGGKFSVEPTEAWIVGGKKAKQNGDWYEIVAIQYATLKLDIDANVTSYTITDGLKDGSTVDIDDEKTVEASGFVFATGYELDDDASTLTVTMTEAKDYTIKVVAKATQSGPTPVDPTEGDCTVTKNDDGSYTVTPKDDSPTATIKGVTSADTIKITSSADFVLTTDADPAAIVMELNGEVVDGKYFKGGDATKGFNTALSDEAKAVLVEETEDDKPLVIGEDVEVTIQSVKGLKYQLVRGTEVGAITEKLGEPVVGDGEPLTLTDADKPADKAFYVIETSK